MNKKWWEDPTIMLVDYWYVFLFLLILVGVLTSMISFPLLTHNGEGLSTPTTVVEEPMPTEEAWLTYNDPELGYSIQYPASWTANVPVIKQQNEYIESVILAEHPGITSQTRNLQESARVLIMSYPKGDVQLQTWIVTHWNWLDGEMRENQISGYQSIRTDVIPTESTFLNSILWIEREDDILCFWAQTDISDPQSGKLVLTIFDRITFLR